MKYYIRSLLISLIVIINFVVSMSQWTQTNGPYGGSVFDFCSSDSGSYIFAGTAHGGIYRSSNNGSSWICVNNGLFPNLYIICLAASNSPNYLFAGNDFGLYRSSDHGDNWTRIGFADTSVRAILINNNYLIVGTYYTGIYRSTNYGNSWIPINNGITYNDIQFLNASGNTIYTASRDHGIYKTTNFGTNWTFIKDCSVRALNAFSSYVFAGLGSNGGIIRSSNYGSNWITVNNGFSDKESNCFMLSGSFLFTGLTDAGIYRTTNYGNNWYAYNNGLEDLNVYSLGKSSSYIFTGTDCGVFRSMNNGADWYSHNSGMKAEIIQSMVLSSTFDVYAGSYGGRIFKTTNNGTSWNEVKNGLEGNHIKAMAANNSYLFAGTANSGVYVANNSGSNWLAVNSGLNDLHINSLVCGGSMVYAGTNGGVYSSNNNGLRWDLANSGITSNIIYDMTTTGSYVFAGTDSGVFRSSNYGTNWISVNSGFQSTKCAWQVKASGSNIYAFVYDFSTEKNIVFRSTNNGSSWFQVNSTFFTLARDIFSTIASDNNVIVSTRAGIYLSTNFGMTWIEKNEGIGSPMSFGRAILIANNYIFAGFRGRSVWRRELNEFLNPVENISSEVPSEFLLSQNYPNPFNPVTKIKFSMTKKTEVKISVYDLLGIEIETLVNEVLQPGVYETTFDGSKLASGVYFCRMDAGNYSNIKKMLLIK